jgi:hypothetical protein
MLTYPLELQPSPLETNQQETKNGNGDGVIRILIGQKIIECGVWKLEDNYCSIITTVAAVFQSKRR